MLCSTLFFTGCGGSNDDEYDNSNNNPSEQNPPGSGTANDAEIRESLNNVAGITLREAMLSGVVDTLIFGTRQLSESEKVLCTSGSYTQVGNTITINQCGGVYSDAIATGTIELSDTGYNFKNFKLQLSNGESQIINGAININEVMASTTLTSDKIELMAQEINSYGKLINVNYILTDYELIVTPKDAANTELQVKAELASTGGEDGDFNVSFNNIEQPFFFKVNAMGDIQGYPYMGALHITDLNMLDNYIILTSIDATKVQYKAEFGGRLIVDQTVNWSEILSY